MFSSAQRVYPKKSQIGLYDDGILCAACDSAIGKWDQYAVETLYRPLSCFGDPSALLRQGFLNLGHPDYAKLKLFFVSLLWRAHHSTLEFFAEVDLGDSAQRAQEMLLSADAGSAEEFGVSIVRFEHPLAQTIHAPHPVRWDGLNGHRFSIPNHLVVMKVDGRSYKESLGRFLLQPDGELFAALFDYETTDLHEATQRNFRNGSFRS